MSLFLCCDKCFEGAALCKCQNRKCSECGKLAIYQANKDKFCLCDKDKVYGLHNNVGEVLESYIEVERILNSEEEKLNEESYAALGFVYDGLKEIFKGKRE